MTLNYILNVHCLVFFFCFLFFFRKTASVELPNETKLRHCTGRHRLTGPNFSQNYHVTSAIDRCGSRISAELVKDTLASPIRHAKRWTAPPVQQADCPAALLSIDASPVCRLSGDPGSGPAATSSPIVGRSRTVKCSVQSRARCVAVVGGEEGDAPRRRRSGARKEAETVSTSHYYRRHRHRARDQSRAMRQVVEWIERAEPSRNDADYGDVDCCEAGRSTSRHGNNCRHEHYHYHYHYCIDGNAWGVC